MSNPQAKFWKPSPPPYWRDIRAWSLLIPAFSAALGAMAYSIQGIAVSQGGAIPDDLTRLIISFGAVALGIGCEGGTLAACIEIARKRRDGDADLITVFGKEISIDMSGLLISYVATVVARVLALHQIQSLPVIVVLVLASAADAYFLFNESGEYLGIRDRNVARWETARFYYEEQRNLPAALHALAHDEPMTLSDDVRKMAEHNTELKAALQDANQEEQRLAQQLHTTQQENERLSQLTQQLSQQLTQLMERVAQQMQLTQPPTQQTQLASQQKTQPRTTEKQQAHNKKQRVVQLLNEGHNETETAQLAGCSYEYARQIKRQMEA